MFRFLKARFENAFVAAALRGEEDSLLYRAFCLYSSFDSE